FSTPDCALEAQIPRIGRKFESWKCSFMIIGRRNAGWRPGRDDRAVCHSAAPGAARLTGASRPVVVAGGGIAGIAAAVGLAERGVRVIMIEPHDQLGGRVR